MRMAALWVACVTAAGCFAGAADENQGLRDLGRGQRSGVRKAEQLVIQTPEAWQKLWAEHTAKVEPRPPLPNVDFNREMVIAVFMGEKPTGGYSIQVTGVKASENALTVTYRTKQPPPDAIVTQALTQPFHFVAVPKSSRPVKFVDETKK